MDQVRQHGGTVQEPTSLARQVQIPAVPSTPSTTLSGPLPAVPFPLVRVACRDLLEPDRHPLSDPLYVDAYRTWRHAIPATSEPAWPS